MAYRHGRDAEDRLLTLLEKRGCTLQTDVTLDHEFKLDAVIVRFAGIVKFADAVGVQFTSRRGDYRKQRVFAESVSHTGVVPRALYVELADPTVDLERGGAEVIYGGLLCFAFDRTFSESRVHGLRIYKDLSFEFFPLDGEPAEVGFDPGTTQRTGRLTGLIARYYFDKGYGFIDPDTGGPDRTEYFVHFTNCSEDLQRLLSSSRTRLPIRVSFRDGGRTRPDAAAPSALDVVEVQRP